MKLTKAVAEEGRRVTRGETIAVAGIGVALLGVIIANWTDTRAGFAELRTEIRALGVELRAEIRDESATLRAETGAIRAEIDALRRELKQDMADLRGELKRDIADLRGELKRDIADLRSDVKRLDVRMDDLSVRMVAVEIHMGVAAGGGVADSSPGEDGGVGGS